MTDQLTTFEEQVTSATDPYERVDAMNRLAWELVGTDADRAMELAQAARLDAVQLGYGTGIATSLRILAHCNLAFHADHETALGQLQESIRIFRDIGDSSGQIRAINLLGSLHRRMGDGQAAIAYHTESLTMAQAVGNSEEEGVALNALGHALAMVGESEQALKAHSQGLEIARRHHHRIHEASALMGLGNTYEKRGRFAESLECYMSCLEIAAETGNRQLKAYASGNVALIYQRFGDNNIALRYELESLRSKQCLNDRWGEGISYNNIGNIYKSLGEYASALEAHLNSLRITEEISDPEGQSVALNSVGLIYAALGDPSKGLEYYQRSLRIAERIGYRLGQAYSFNHIGRFYEGQGDYPKALIHYVKSLKLHRDTGNRYGEREALKSIGDIHLYVDELEKASEHYHASLRITDETGDREGKGDALLALAELEWRRGQLPRAAEHLHDTLKIAGEMSHKGLTGRALGRLSDLYEALGNSDRSEAFRNLYAAVHRELFSDEMKERIRELISGFEGRSARREAELLGLRQEDLADVDEALRKVGQRRTEQILARAGSRELPVMEWREPSSPAISVRTFGEFGVTIGGRELRRADWHRKRARDMFKLLLLNHGRAVTIDDMVEHLWGGITDRNAELLVMNAVSHIRRALEPEREPRKPSAILSSSDRAYTLDLGSESLIDFIRFRNLIADARRTDSPDLKRRLYMETLGLHTGEFLKEDLYERWTEPERERLRGMLYEALTYLGGEYLREGRFEEAIAMARRLLDCDATSERGHEILIAALISNGQPAEARKAFGRCTTIFRSELGIDPPEYIRRAVGEPVGGNGYRV